MERGDNRAPRLPLFERMAAGGHGRALDATGLRASIGRELARLMNARSSPRTGHALTVIDYGLPDPGSLYADNAEDRDRLARSLLRAITAFEPRLLTPRVEVLPHLDARKVQVGVTGTISIDGRIGSVRFRAVLGQGGAEAQAMEDE